MAHQHAMQIDSLSDPENTERPVREKLKQATLANTNRAASPEKEYKMTLSKKRSLEDIEGDDDTAQQARKRSRSASPIRAEKEEADVVESLAGDKEELMEEVTEDSKHASEQEAMEEPDEEAKKEPANGTATDTDTSLQNGDMVDAPATPPSLDIPPPKTNGSVLSPHAKRNRDQFLQDDASPAPETEENSVSDAKGRPKDASNSVKGTSTEERSTKRHRDSPEPVAVQPVEKKPNEDTKMPSEPASKLEPTSGFANTSAASPFSALSGSKSPLSGSISPLPGTKSPLSGISSAAPQTSSSAFAASGFSAHASAASPFASTANKSSESPFGAVKPAGASSSLFGASAFSGSASPFSSLAGKGSESLKSLPVSGSSIWGTGSTEITGISKEPPKEFGAAEDDDDDADDKSDDEGAAEMTEGEVKDPDDAHKKIKSPTHDDAPPKKDKRFYEQEVETGEEGESSRFTSRAKLYNFHKTEGGKGEWKERGVGVLKLNVESTIDSTQDEEADEIKVKEIIRKARFVMRADGSHRVILNSPIKKELNVGSPTGEKPTGSGMVYFLGTLDGKLEQLLLKLRLQNAQDLWSQVQKIQEQMQE